MISLTGSSEAPGANDERTPSGLPAASRLAAPTGGHWAYWSLSAAKLRAQREDYIHRGTRWRGTSAGRWRHVELPLEIWRMPVYGRFMEPMLTDGGHHPSERGLPVPAPCP